MEKQMNLQAAIQLQKTGYDLVLVRHGTKKAAFPSWQERSPLTRGELTARMRYRLFNIGIWVKVGLLVFDLDNKDLAWGKERGIDSPMICKTARGFHVYMRGILNKSRKFEGGDIKATGYVMAPPSVVNEWRYEWLNGVVSPDQLPDAPKEFLEVKEVQKPTPRPMPIFNQNITAMRNWIRRVTAVEGEGGDRNTFRVAIKICSIIKDEAQALAEIMSWQSEGNAIPLWSEKELLWKIRSAQKYLEGR